MLLSKFKEENVLKVIFKTSIIFYHIEFYIFLITFSNHNISYLWSYTLSQVAIASNGQKNKDDDMKRLKESFNVLTRIHQNILEAT